MMHEGYCTECFLLAVLEQNGCTNYWGEPERGPHVREVQRVRLYNIHNIYIIIYIYYIYTYYISIVRMDKMAALCVAVACDSNTRRG